MSAEIDRLLLCTNGAEASFPAMEYGAWLAARLDLGVTLLGIEESLGRRSAVESMVERVTHLLENTGTTYEIVRRPGRSKRVIPAQLREGQYLTILGPLGRELWRRWVRGRSFRRIQENVGSPLVYTRFAHFHSDRFLVCMGGLGYAQSVLDSSLILAGKLGASLTLLHVVEPISYEYPTALEVESHRETVLDTDTPQGRSLREALQKAEAAGVSAEVKVRSGSPIHEIIGEIHTGRYDLVCMGSPFSTRSLRRLYTPNVTAEVAEAADRPILTEQFVPLPNG